MAVLNYHFRDMELRKFISASCPLAFVDIGSQAKMSFHYHLVSDLNSFGKAV